MTVEGPVVGRDVEMSALAAFLDGVTTGPARTAVIAGPAGMGKTTLWRSACVDARARGFRVLEARPTEVEATLAYAGLHDLTRDLDRGTLASLPATPADGARGGAVSRPAALRGPGGGWAARVRGHRHRRTVARPLSGGARVRCCVAIDDLQWLDQSSLGPLRFLVRRLGGEAVGVLVAVRSAADGQADAAAGLDPPDGRPQRLDLGPLSLGALHRLIGDRAGVSLPRPGLVHLHELTGGNPYMALELIREWGPDAVTSLRSDQRLPGTMDDLLVGRVAQLTPPERSLAQAVAAIGRPTDALLARVLAEVAGIEPITDRAIESGRPAPRGRPAALLASAARIGPAGTDVPGSPSPAPCPDRGRAR